MQDETSVFLRHFYHVLTGVSWPEVEDLEGAERRSRFAGSRWRPREDGNPFLLNKSPVWINLPAVVGVVTNNIPGLRLAGDNTCKGGRHLKFISTKQKSGLDKPFGGLQATFV